MKIKEFVNEAAVWKSNRVPSAPAANTPAGIARPAKPSQPKSNAPSNFRKGLYKMTGLFGNDAVNSAVAKDNFIKKFASEYDALNQDQTGAFNPKDYLNSVITQNNWGPLTPQQQLALNGAIRTNDSKKISSVIYQIGKQNRGGSSVAGNRQVGKPMNANMDPNSKNTLGQPDRISPTTDRIINSISMMASASNIDDLQKISRAALNAMHKAAPGEYAEFVKFIATGQKPQPNAQQQHPADDNPNINLGSNE